jgi:catechol 2,3-dioxygenase-like lactoylglutathione lyase family enzyme
MVPLVVQGLQHVGLIVADVDASCRFYGDVLGLERVPRPESFTFGGAWFRAGGDEVHLIARDDTTQRDPPQEPGPGLRGGFATHVAFVVDDIEAALAGLASHGVEPAAGPLRRGDGVVQVYLRDPDGYVVELFATSGEDQSGTVRGPIRA